MSCTCTWKGFRAGLGIFCGIAGVLDVLHQCVVYFLFLDIFVESVFIKFVLCVYEIIYTVGMVLACIGMIYTVVKSDTKYVTYIMRLFMAGMVCNLIRFFIDMIILYSSHQDAIDILTNLFKLYLISKIRDDIDLEKAQVPPVYYDTQQPPQYAQAAAQGGQLNPQYQMQQFPAPGNQAYSQIPQTQPNIQGNPMYPPMQQQYQQTAVPPNQFYDAEKAVPPMTAF